VEIFVDDRFAHTIWNAILSDPSGEVVPVGLGARDTLRLEKGYLLSGQDFLWPQIGDGSDIFPSGFLARNSAETAVPYGIDMAHDFIGKERISISASSVQKWTGLICLERGPSPRPGHPVMDGPDSDSKVIGFVTSGGPSPSLGMSGIAMAYIDRRGDGSEVWIQSSSRRRIRSQVVTPPFVDL
ncbi:MAG TPA: glycine cleavage T C-terminal barrel domain-containing protein, partial [Candidatus Thalassarchaeaceae archaeon]|nr:glycine cleavage T C-terminal barrel domain-containing protein [Candidatus Thalassarchaeaceae archaeon]